MKHYTLIILCLTILLSACRKETSSIIGEIDTTEETEFEATVFRGQVTDKDKNGLQTTIDIYQFENKIGTINSDSDGNYITEEVFIEPDVQVTFDIFSESFRNKYRRITKGKGKWNIS